LLLDDLGNIDLLLLLHARSPRLDRIVHFVGRGGAIVDHRGTCISRMLIPTTAPAGSVLLLAVNEKSHS